MEIKTKAHETQLMKNAYNIPKLIDKSKLKVDDVLRISLL